jgi:Icc-related predicted phosphoesterase
MSLSVCCISDTHCLHRRLILPQADILIVAGDITNKGEIHKLSDFNFWLGSYAFKKVFVVAGNHDFCFAKGFKGLLTNATYLEDSSVMFEGLKIYGSPWSPWYHGDVWCFNRRRGSDIEARWKLIPEDADIVITHGPPFGILDKVGNENAGCKDLLNHITRVSPKLHVFGHLHQDGGQVFKTEKTTFVNAAICSHVGSGSLRKPVVIDL